MSTYDFLSKLKSQDIIITLDGERLKINAPKGALSPTLKTELGQRKAEILTFLRQADNVAETVQLQPIEPVSREGRLPLSFAQQRIWDLYQLEPTSSGLNVPVAWRLTGKLDVAALQAALHRLVQRQETLRTIFLSEDGQPLLRILPEATLQLELVDLHDLPDASREARRLVEEEAMARPFDISNRPPVRATLYQLKTAEYIFLLNFHQIIFDWGAAGALINDLVAFYQQQIDNVAAEPADLSVQYIDYANWQQERQKGKRQEKQLAFWQQQLGKPYQPLRLPVEQNKMNTADSACDLDRRSAQAVNQPEREAILIPEPLVQSLKSLSQQEGATLFMVMMTAINILLYSQAQQEDILLFSTAGHDRSELKQIVGLFANPLAYRTDLSGNPSFRQLLQRVKKIALQAHAHQDLPFEKMIEQLPLATGSGNGRSSLFQILFLYQHQPTPPLTLPGLQAELLTVGVHAPGFDMRFFLEEATAQLRGWLEYSADTFAASTITQLLQNLQALLPALIANPDTPLVELAAALPNKLILATEQSLPEQVEQETVQYVAARDETEQKMVAIWEDLLKTSPISIKADYFELGGYSLLATRLFKQIEGEFGKRLALSTLIQASTVEKLADLVKGDATSEATAWNSLVKIQAGDPSRPPLFLIHGAGGNILLYRDLASHLGSNQPVYGLQAQGLDGQGDYLTRFEDMAARYIKEIREVQPHGPYFFGGYCLGGTLSFEMAKQLETVGEKVALVAMFETFNIHANPAVMTKKYQLMHKVQNLWFHARNVLELSPKDMIAFLQEKASVSLGRVQDKWQSFVASQKQGEQLDEADLPHIILDKVNDKAQEDYYPEWYNGRIDLFRPKKDFIGNEDPEFGWSGLASEINVCRLDVNPRGMLVEPYVRQLATTLRNIMDELVQASGAETDSILQGTE
jgi:thioesterase domain-containing protein